MITSEKLLLNPQKTNFFTKNKRSTTIQREITKITQLLIVF